MADNIEIVVQDKISSSISTKLQAIAGDARSADSAVKSLQASLNSVSASSGLQKLQTELAKTALNQQKLATETQKTQTAMANVETALNRAVAAEAKATLATNKLTEANAKNAASAAAVAEATAAKTAAADADGSRIKKMVADSLALQAANAKLGESETSLAERAGARTVLSDAQRKAIQQQVLAQDAQMVSMEGYTVASAAETVATEANTVAQVENAAAFKLNSRATSELGVLLGELASGNMGRMRQTTASLANQTGLLAKLMTTTGLAILGTTAIIATLISWVIKGYTEFERLNTAVIITGNSSGSTAGQISQMSNQLATANVNARQMNELLTGLVGTGRTTSETLASVGMAASNMLALTGQSVDQVVSSFEKLYDDPLAWADKMDTKWHFLTVNVRDHVKALEDAGHGYEAAEVVAAAFADNTKSKVDALNASMGTLQKLMQRWSQGVANIKGFVFNIGAPKDAIQQFTELRDKYVAWQAETKGLDSDYIRSVDAHYQAELKALQPAAQQLQLMSKVNEAQDQNRKALLDSSKVIDSVNDKTQKQLELQTKLKALKESYQTTKNLGGDTSGARFKGVSFNANGDPSGGVYQSKVDQLNKEYADKGDVKAQKAAESRAQSLAGVNLQLNNQIQALGLLGPAQELQQKYDSIEQSLQKKHITLTAQETASIKQKLQTISDGNLIQQKANSIYQEITGPSRDYNATLTAANALLKDGTITQAQFNDQILSAVEAYKSALDPLYQMNKDLDQQLTLLQLLPKQREIEQQVLQAENASLAKHHTMNQQEIDDLRQKLALIQQTNLVSQQQASLLANSVDKRQATGTNISAIKNLQGDKTSGFTKGDASSSVTKDLQSSGIDTTGFAEQSQTYTQQYQDMYAKIDEYRQADLLSEQSAAAAKQQVWAQGQSQQLQSTVGFLGGISQLMKSHNKEQFKVGKAAAIAQAGIQTYLGAIQAFTSLSAIPIVGPILGAVAAAAAVAAGLAQIQNIRSQQMTGFQTGGYTGNAAVNEVVGAVHGKEFVSTAATTAKYRPQLEAMHRGTYDPNGHVGGYNGGNSASAPVVVPAPSIKLINVKSMDEARDFANSDENEQVVLNIMQKNGLTH